MFPGPNAQVHYNDAGEPLGWDYPSDEPYDEPDESAHGAAYDNYMEALYEEHADGQHEGSPYPACDECDIEARKENP